jgi:hypothetical protein
MTHKHVGEDPLADQSSGKRQRISHQEASTPLQQVFSTSTEDSLWVTWNNSHKREVEETEEERDLEFLEASIPRDMQERMVWPMSHARRNTAIIGDYVDAAIREDVILQQRLRYRPNGMSSLDNKRDYMLNTKAAVQSIRGIVELRVKIAGSSVRNLLPQSIASRLLRLPLHFGKSIRIKVANHILPTNQYCQFNIQVAGVETMIDACVV